MGALNVLIHFLQYVLDFVFEIVNRFIKKAKLPPITENVLVLSATQLAAKIRSRELTAEFVMEAFISRIKGVNGALNCFIMKNNRFEDALREAREVDDRLDSEPDSPQFSEEKKPYLGVPFTSKEAFQIKGLQNSSGMVALKDKVATEDAAVVKKLKDAGAIALGVTVVPEMCMWWETSNFVYGRTSNAYDSRRIVGGSSGGEACLISAAGSVWGVGSDIGGSIRMPAFFNGIFGHKPSRRKVPNTGQFPGDPRDDDQLVTGPLCRYSEDLIPMLMIMAGPDNSTTLNLSRPVDLGNTTLRIYSVPDMGDALGVSPVSQELRDIQKQVEEVLRTQIGARVNPEHSECFDEFEDTFVMWNSQQSFSGSPSFCQLLGSPSDQPINPWKELILRSLKLSKHTLPAIGLGLTERLDKLPLSVKQEFVSKAAKLETAINTMLGEDGIILLPSSADYAYYHNQPIYKCFNCVYTMIFNVLGFPVTQVPLGLGRKGVPLGIQVAGAHDNDRLTIAVAKLLDRHFGGWVKPSWG